MFAAARQLLSGVRSLTETLEQLPEIVRQRRFELHLSVVGGMAECQTVCVKRLSCKRNRPQPLRSVDVASLPDQRVAAQTRLNPDLVSLSRVQTHFEEGHVGERLDDAITAHRLGSLRVARMRPLLDECLAIPDEVIAPHPLRWLRNPVDERQVYPLRFALNELLFECLLGAWILREHHETRGVAIDAMHDERPAPLRTQVLFKPIVDRWLRIFSRQRNRQQSCRLVDHQEDAVFVDDVERCGPRPSRRARAQVESGRHR